MASSSTYTQTTEKKSLVSWVLPPGSREFEWVFRRSDANDDGKISAEELRLLVRSTVGEELSIEEAEEAIRSVDSDGDGLLEAEEFLTLVGVEAGEEEEEEELRRAFAVYKVQGEGCITPRSLRQVLSRLGAPRALEDCRAMIRRFDLDGDGVLSFEEFRTMMML